MQADNTCHLHYITHNRSCIIHHELCVQDWHQKIGCQGPLAISKCITCNTCHNGMVTDCNNVLMPMRRLALIWNSISITVTSYWAWWCFKSPAPQLFTQALFRRRWKKTSKLCITGLCEGNSLAPGEFPEQRASNAENVIFHEEAIQFQCWEIKDNAYIYFNIAWKNTNPTYQESQQYI